MSHHQMSYGPTTPTPRCLPVHVMIHRCSFPCLAGPMLRSGACCHAPTESQLCGTHDFVFSFTAASGLLLSHHHMSDG